MTILVDDKHAVMTQATLENLPEYSLSLPTGTTPGKRWRRWQNPRWWMGEYYDFGDCMGIRWREILTI